MFGDLCAQLTTYTPYTRTTTTHDRYAAPAPQKPPQGPNYSPQALLTCCSLHVPCVAGVFFYWLEHEDWARRNRHGRSCRREGPRQGPPGHGGAAVSCGVGCGLSAPAVARAPVGLCAGRVLLAGRLAPCDRSVARPLCGRFATAMRPPCDRRANTVQPLCDRLRPPCDRHETALFSCVTADGLHPDMSAHHPPRATAGRVTPLLVSRATGIPCKKMYRKIE